MQNRICDKLEIARWILLVAAFQLAYIFGASAAERFEILAPLVIIPLSGLTGFESVFFGRAAANASGYGVTGRRYQIQSGLNNLAVALAAVVVWYYNWGILAYAALMTATLLFYGFSAVNHAAAAVVDGNKNWKNLARPFMTAILIIAVLTIMLPALK